MESEPIDLAPRYRLCRLGFGLLAVSMALLFVAKVTTLPLFFGVMRILELWRQDWWLWVVDAPITWLSLAGSYWLIGRWDDPAWRRRSGLLLIMNAIDAGLWVIDHAEDLGLAAQGLATEHRWLLYLTGAGLGWFEIRLMGLLAGEVTEHLGADDGVMARQRIRVLSTIGLIVWVLLAVTQTDWLAWPPARMPTREFRLLLMIQTGMGAIATFHLTVLLLQATRLCGLYARTIDERGWDPAELTSRSETENDPAQWR